MGFCTVNDIEIFLLLSIDDPDQIESAEHAIEEVTEGIKGYCHQQIELVEDDVITLDVRGGYKVFLPELPVVTVSSVVEDGEALTSGADEDYQLGQHGILHRVGEPWKAGVQILQITYDHGYATLPRDVVEVCARAAGRRFQAGLKSSGAGGIPGITSMGLGDYSVSYGGETGGGAGEGIMGASAARVLLLSEKDILNRYRYVAQ